MAGGATADRNKASPQTPPCCDSLNSPDSQAESMKNSDKKTDSGPDTDSTSPTPSRPFLAYARRVRSFSSPFQLQKSRYLLTFADEATAQEWWALMQSEYPETIRESPQLFSFKSNRVPLRATSNPKFAHLQGKWRYRELTESEKGGRGSAIGIGNSGGGGERQATSEKRGSIGRSPLMPVVREGSSSPELVRDTHSLEDPFTPTGGPAVAQEKTGLAQLNITSDRIHKAVSQSSANIDTLAKGQRASAKSMQIMQAEIERMTMQVGGMMESQSRCEETMREAQSSISRDTSDIKAEWRQSDVLCVAGMQNLQAEVAQNSARVRTLIDDQKAARKQMLRLQATLDQQADSQAMLAEHMQAIQVANTQNQALIRDLAQGQNAQFGKLLAAFEQHTKQNQEMMIAQQSAVKSRHEEVLAAIKDNTQTCTHDVLPPPRKMNRKLVGYVYSRNGS